MNSDQFARMKTADSQDFELVDGGLIPLPSASLLHAIIRGQLERSVLNYFDSNPSEARPAKSIAISPRTRWANVGSEEIPLAYAPDIAVEVFSPSENAVRVNRKVRDYFEGGSREVWLLDPDNVELHVRTKSGIRLSQDGDALESPLLPGFSVSVRSLLATLL